MERTITSFALILGITAAQAGRIERKGYTLSHWNQHSFNAYALSFESTRYLFAEMCTEKITPISFS